MLWLLETAAGNALLVTLMSPIVLLAGRVWRRAALLHIVWVLVLIKLVTPGLVPVEIPGPWAGVWREPQQVVDDDSATAAIAPSPVAEDGSSRVAEEQLAALQAALDAERAEARARQLAAAEGQTQIEVDAQGRPRRVETPGARPSGDDLASVGEMDRGGDPSGALVPAANGGVTFSKAEPAGAVRSHFEAAAAAVQFGIQQLMAWLPVLCVVSLLGTACWLLVAAIRIARFHAELRHARSAPRALRQRVLRLARRIGLSRAPIVQVIPGCISPMVWWPLGTPRLLFPSELLNRLEGEALDALLLHELAHLRRRDHWVRWLELLVTAFCWWHPVVWIARREIHACEEECCDALVVQHLPGCGKKYAGAIIETLDFLAGEPRPAATPLASGIGQLVALERRLKLIMRPKTAAQLTLRGRLAALTAALALLPLLPTLAQNEPSAEGGTPQGSASAAPAAGEAPRSAAGAASTIRRLPEGAGRRDPTEFEPQSRGLGTEPGEVFSLDVSPDGRHIAVATGRSGTPGSVILLEASLRRTIRSWRSPRGIAAVRFSPDSRRLAAVGWDRELIVRDLASEQVLFKADVGNSAARLAYSPDGKLLATATEGLKDENQLRRGHEVKLWNAETGAQIAALEGDLARFQDVAFSPDGKLLATCGGELDQGEGQINVWEVDSLRQLVVVRGHARAVLGICFSPDSSLIASGSYDGTAKLWDARSGMLKASMAVPGGVYQPAFSPDGAMLATPAVEGGVVKLWSVPDGRELGELRGHSRSARAADFAPDGRVIVTGGSDRTVRFWDVSSRQQLEALTTGNGDAQQTVLALAHSPDGRLIAVAGEDRSVLILDAAEGKQVHRLEGFDDVVAALAFSPDGRQLATGSFDNTARLWNVSDATLSRQFEGHTNWVYAVAFSADGKLLATGGYDKTIRVWNVADGTQVALLQGHTAAVRSLAFAPGGDVLVSGSADRTLKLWKMPAGTELRTLKGHEGAIRAVAVSPDGATAASAAEDKQVRVWDLASGGLRFTLAGHEDLLWSLAFSPGGKTLASGDFAGRIKLWNPETGQERATLSGHSDAVSALSFAPDGSALVSGGYDKSIRVWQAKLPPIAAALAISQPSVVSAVAFSPDGSLMAFGGDNRQVTLYDLRSNSEIRRFSGHKSGVHRLCFSPDGQTLASGSHDATVRLWNVKSGALIAVLEGHEESVRDLAFTADGTRLASAGWEGALIVWDMETNSVRFRLPKQSLPVTGAAFTPDGKLLATSTGNWREWQKPGDLKLWNGETGEPIFDVGNFELEIKWTRISPDGRLLIGGGAGRKIKVFDLATRSKLREIEHSSALIAGAFLPAGSLLATGDMKGGMQVWDVNSGRMVARFEGHSGMVSSLVVSSDGTLVASTSADKTVKLWPVPLKDLQPATENHDEPMP
jgi:WD40 repeat protein/beta-lactamase regulating signal transducer with metallopeptidase domain